MPTENAETLSLKSNLKTMLPRPVRGFLRSLVDAIPGTKGYYKKRWLKKYYSTFATSERERMFLGISRFFHINRPMNGYYLEFGCFQGRSMRLAHKHFRHLFDFTYVAFDSFEGLPEIQKIDQQELWVKGKQKTAVEDFRGILTRAGMPDSKLITVKGFFDKSLNSDLQKKLLPTKAAVIFVDCSLYTSTIPVLEFCVPFLQQGTILVFDGWNCYFGDPHHGERRAFNEFRKKYPDMIFEDFVSTNEMQSYIYIDNNRDLN